MRPFALSNPEAKGSREIQATVDPPSVYVGERGRSIQERLREHHDDEKRRSNKSHMWKHRMLHHQGGAAPFVVKAVSFHRTALSRQAAEAVSIRRRGGEGMILNSRAKFNRCFIPRLTLMQDEVIKEMEKEEEMLSAEILGDISRNQEEWEGDRVRIRSENIREELMKSRKQEKRSSKEEEEGTKKRRTKKLKYEKMEDDLGGTKTTSGSCTRRRSCGG